MASIPAPPPTLRDFEVKVTGRKGKAPPTITTIVQASNGKEAKRIVMNALLGGRYEMKDLSPAAAEADAAKPAGWRTTLGLARS